MQRVMMAALVGTAATLVWAGPVQAATTVTWGPWAPAGEAVSDLPATLAGGTQITNQTFYVAANGALRVTGWSSYQKVWSRPVTLNGSPRALDRPAVAEVQGLQYTFVRGPGNKLYVGRTGDFWLDADAAFTEVPGGGTTLHAPAAAVENGVLHLIVRAENGKIVENRMTVDGGTPHWSGWLEVGGNGSTPDAPAAVTYDGKLHVIVHSTGGVIYQNTFAGSWSGWTAVPGLHTDKPVALSQDQYNGVRMFARFASSGVIWMNTYTTGWSGWVPVPDSITTDAPAAASTGGNFFQLMVRAPGGQLYMRQGVPF